MPNGGSLGEREITLLSGARVAADFQVEWRWIDRRLAMGGMVGTRANALRVRDAGITHVINLQDELDDRPLFEGTDVSCFWRPISDGLRPFPGEQLVATVELAERILGDGASRLLVHCMAGRNRAPLLAWAILCAQGMPAGLASATVRHAEPAALLADEHLQAAQMALAGRP